jgi:parallel beta-helix repeat protein
MAGSTGDTATWSVDGIAGGNATVGTISAAGVYTCPAVNVQAIHTITATSAHSPGVSASVPILATVSNTTTNAKTQYGATGNGSTDDTAAINSALNASGTGICYLPAGTYMINATANSSSYGLDIPAGATLLMAPGATLKCITQSTTGDYKVVRMAASNSAVVGGAVIGDRVARNLPSDNDGVGTDFENGNGFAINGSGGGTNMIALGVAVSNNCNDGFYLYNGVNGVTIWGCTSDNNRRQGLSIVYGSNVLIQNCTFTNTNGQDPGNGIDLEPSGSGQTVTNVQILGSTFTGNKGGGIQTDASNASVNNITISGNTISGNGGQDYGIGGMYIEHGASYFTVTNNTITGNVAGGDDGGIVFDNCTHSTISGNIIKNNAGYGISLSSASGTTVSGNTVSGNSSGTIYNDGSASVN